MVRWFFRLLYGSIPVRFASPYSRDEAMKRLSAVVKPSLLNAFSGQCAVGIVSEKMVRIQRVIPLVGNAWKPFFYGSFVEVGEKAALEGVFRFSTSIRIFMSIWFGFVAFITLVTALLVFADSACDVSFPLFGLSMFGIGIAMVSAGKWFARNDIAWLTGVIAHALGTSDPQTGDRTELAHNAAQLPEGH